jgi:parallel beta-helix repeat protein
MKIISFCITIIITIMLFAATPNQIEAKEFIQGQCGQTIRESIILTKNIGPCSGDGIVIKGNGITLDGDGYKILGSGNGNGVILAGKKNITIKNLFVIGFENGIYSQRASGNEIYFNRISENSFGIYLFRTSETTVTKNVVVENEVGISAKSPTNKIYHNILINNQVQIEDISGNIWEDSVHHFGNFWGNYWGEDDGSNGRIAGDFIGDTQLPHEGVDFSPLLDPTKTGSFLCGDWWGSSLWLVWRGGWSPVKLQVTNPEGLTISRDVNHIGIDAFYVEDDQIEPNSTLAQIIIMPCGNISQEGDYLFEMTGLGNLTYTMTHFVSRGGEVMLDHQLQDIALYENETQDIKTILDSNLTAQLAILIDIKPHSDPNTINIGSDGVIPLAILSSPTFDATSVDPDTIRLEAATVKLVGKGEKDLSHEEDINGDELLDLMCQVLVDELQVVAGDSVAELTATTFGGTPIYGEDFIRIINN